MSLNDLAKTYGISKASVCRVIKDAKQAVSKTLGWETLLNLAHNGNLAASDHVLFRNRVVLHCDQL